MGGKNLKKREKTPTGRITALRPSRKISNCVVIGLVCIFLAAIVWIAFGRAIHNEFVSYDDGEYVYKNPRITNGLTLDGIQWAFTHVHAANWHPLTTISHMLDCSLYGLQPWGHHLTNILLHATAAVLLFLALLRLTSASGLQLSTLNSVKERGSHGALRSQPSTINDQPSASNIWACAFVAALFAVHPLRVESVAWVSERKDVLSGVFFSLTLLAYARYARSCSYDATLRQIGAATTTRWPLGSYLAVIIFFALGLLCKPTLVTLPFVLLLLDYWPLNKMQNAKGEGQRAKREEQSGVAALVPSAERRNKAFDTNTSTTRSQWSVVRGLVVEKIPLFVLSAASCVATVLAQKQALEKSLNLTFIERAGNAVVSYVAYLGQMFYPAKLAVLYPYQERTLQTTVVVLNVLLLLVISFMSFIWRQKHPYLLAGWLWYLGMLVPMIGVVQVGLQTRADRYTYLPQIGLYIMATWGAVELFARWRFGRQILAVTAVVVVTALAACTYQEASYWKSSETLWKHAIENTSNNDIAYYNLGTILLRKRQPDAAIVEFQKALQINPGYGDADADLGSALMLMGQTDQAISHFRRALQIKPDFAAAWSNLGSALVKTGQVDEAIQCYQKAVAIEPGSGEMRYNLGLALASKSDWGAAIACYKAALQMQPNDVKVHNSLGVALAKIGKMDEALDQLNEALRINLNYPEAHYNLGCVLAHLGRNKEAAAQFEDALRLKPDYSDAKEQLQHLGVRESP